jgi:hypothetical protein
VLWHPAELASLASQLHLAAPSCVDRPSGPPIPQANGIARRVSCDAPSILPPDASHCPTKAMESSLGLSGVQLVRPDRGSVRDWPRTMRTWPRASHLPIGLRLTNPPRAHCSPILPARPRRGRRAYQRVALRMGDLGSVSSHAGHASRWRPVPWRAGAAARDALGRGETQMKGAANSAAPQPLRVPRREEPMRHGRREANNRPNRRLTR